MKANKRLTAGSSVPPLPAEHAPLPLFSRETRTVFRAGRGGKGGKGRRTRKGSVLILVVAILVLLALMGTAYITSTRNDRAAATVAGSVASVDTVAQGIIDSLKASLARERMTNITGTGYTLTTSMTGFASNTSSGTLAGSALLASRVPTLSASGVPQWFSITSSLDTTVGSGSTAGYTGSFENPLATSTVAATFGTTTIDSVNNPQYFSTNSAWGSTVSSRTNTLIGSIRTSNGQVYPAFFSGGRAVCAADADGDGIADSGLVRIGNIPGPEYGDVTFYYGLRVIDNNSAFNANTAWTSGPDKDFAGAPVRNNRLFPGAIGLRESLLSDGSGDPIDPFETDTLTGVNSWTFQSYRCGAYNKRNGGVALDTDSTPFGDYGGSAQSYRPSTLSQPYTRNDFIFSTQQELMWSQLATRIGTPGMHGTNTPTQVFAFQPFTIDEQAQLASRFVIAPYIAGDSYSTARLKRAPLEQLLAPSLYRFGGITNAASSSLTNTYGSMPTSPYSPSAIGVSTGSFTTTSTNWFTQNFDYAVTPGPGANLLTIANLRPLLVARNPVAQSTTFKPLPESAVLASTVAGSTNDRMTPYVPYYESGVNYMPGEVVFYTSAATGNAKLFVNAWAEPVSAAVSPLTTASYAAAVTAARPWLEYAGPVVPGKVNVNTAPFGDLWRGFYLAMSSDAIDPANVSGYSGTNATISPFGYYFDGTSVQTPAVLSGPAEIFRGMEFVNLVPPAPQNAALEGDATNPTNLTSKLPPITGTETAVATGTAPANYHPQRQFRSKLKDLGPSGNAVIPPSEMVKLRAAQAAVNAEYLRRINSAGVSSRPGGRDDIVRRNIALDVVFGAATSTVTAEVYSHGRSVYITEAYASTAPSTSGGYYVAIELHNPYPFSISLENYRIEVIDRSQTSAVGTTGRLVDTIFTFGAGTVVAPNGYLVIENTIGLAGAAAAGATGTYTASVNATARPLGTGVTGTSVAGGGVVVSVPGLEAALQGGGKELVLSRPMFATFDGAGTTLTCEAEAVANTIETGTIDAAIIGKEAREYYVPVDSIDFAGVRDPGLTVTDSVEWPQQTTGTASHERTRDYAYDYHYMRDTSNWRFVYPGRYDGRAASSSGPVGPKQQGMREALRRSKYEIDNYNPAADQPPPIDDTPFTTPAPTLGAASDGTATYDQTLTIQIANVGFGGLNATVSANSGNANRYPFGGLMRELDMLQIPFISPVRIRPTGPLVGGNYIDIISLTQDAAFAEDSDTRDNAEENVGRFAPIITPATTTVGSTFYDSPSNTTPYVINEFSADTRKQRYGWANKLLEYLTVRSARDFSLPMAKGLAQGTTATVYSQDSYPLSSGAGAQDNLPQPVPNSAGTLSVPNKLSGYDAGIEGLVNINTAPLPVLAAVPWVNSGNVTQDRGDNISIAKAIIAEREARGPFRSLFELNRVRGFRTMNAAQFTTPAGALGAPLAPWGTEPADAVLGTSAAFTGSGFRTNTNGDFSPPATGTFPTNTQTPSPDYPGTYSASGFGVDPGGNRNPVNDYEAQYLAVTAVSNLLTTRSDTFTAYLVIEGWRNAGTAQATRVVQRRFAFILDRTGVAPAIPVPLMDGDPGVSTGATVAGSAAITPTGKSGAVQNSVRVTPVPMP